MHSLCTFVKNVSILILFSDTQAGSISVTTIVMIGKFFIAGSFAIIYNYTAELFPTVVRNTALGVGSMGARLSGALTPLITLLVRSSLNYREAMSGLVTFDKFCLLCFVSCRETKGWGFNSDVSLL
jgi:tetrahydromethanopterin S-methyltransferase subunit C